MSDRELWISTIDFSFDLYDLWNSVIIFNLFNNYISMTNIVKKIN